MICDFNLALEIEEMPTIVNPGTEFERREWRTRLGALTIANRYTRQDDEAGIDDYLYRVKHVGRDRYIVEILNITGVVGYL